MYEVVEIGGAAVGPVHQVVGVGERHRVNAARPLAATRPSPQRRPGGVTRHAHHRRGAARWRRARGR